MSGAPWCCGGGPVGHAQTGARAPPEARLVRPVVAGFDAAEAARRDPGGDLRVQQALHQPERLARGLRQPADERRPQRGYRAGSPDHGVLPVHPHLVAGPGIGIARDVGHAPAGSRRPGDRGHPGGRLPCGQLEHVAHPATGRPAVCAVVPHRLGGDLPGRRVQPQAGAAAGERVRAGRGEVGVGFPVGNAIAAAVVT